MMTLYGLPVVHIRAVAKITVPLLLLLFLVSRAPAEEPPRYLIAPSGEGFLVPDAVQGDPGETARRFVMAQRPALGFTSPNVSFAVAKVKADGPDASIVRLGQAYTNVRFFGAELVVRLKHPDRVEYVVSRAVTDTAVLDQGQLVLTPEISAEAATTVAVQQFAAHVPPGELQIAPPGLRIFDPRFFGLAEPLRLTWRVQLEAEEYPEAGYDVLVDAHNGQIVRAYPGLREALDRKIYDAGNSNNNGSLARDEGDPATGITDVDNTYMFVRDAYDFFSSRHGRDSLDDSGLTLKATVRWCDTAASGNPCPFSNAFYAPWNERMYFGQGMTADDVVAHEYTHGVTSFSSGLVYENTSGALDEGMADIWGESIDLANSAGTDTPAVKWLLGEDSTLGAIRSLANPTTFGDPDRLGHPNYTPPVANPNGNNDFGAVHSNSGIVNKLFFLLVDGQDFNGQSVFGVGRNRTLDIFYEANTTWLTPGSGFSTLYDGLHVGAEREGWTAAERNNLYAATLAVEIADEEDVYVDVNWSGLEYGLPTLPFDTFGEGVDVARPGDRVLLQPGTYSETMRIEERLTLVAPSGAVRIGG